MKRRSGEITTEHVLEKEGPAQQRRRERKAVLKKEFRNAASVAAKKVFGIKSPMVDIVGEKENCTESIVEGARRSSSRSQFDEALLNFLSEIRFENEEGKKRIGNITEVWDILRLKDELLEKKLIIASIELMMATEDSGLLHAFLAKAETEDRETALKMLDGIIKFSKIDYIHTIDAYAKAFVLVPEESADMIDKMANRVDIRPSQHGVERRDSLPSDFVLSGVVKSNFGL